MKYLLIVVLASNFLFADFSRSNNVVTDNTKHLQWDDEHKILKEWKDAINYCSNLNMNSKQDWRLPNINELMSITNYSQKSLIDPIFLTKNYAPYWSATSDSTDGKRGYSIEFNPYGNILSETKTKRLFVRCVRTVK